MTDWQIVTVDELAAKKKGSLATGPFGSSIGSKTFRDSGIPLIRGSNLSECVEIRLDETGIVYVEEDLAREFARSVAVKGDLVFTCWGTISQVGLIDDSASFARYIVSNKQMKLTLDEALASPLFVYYFFSSPRGQHQIQINAIGSSVPGFNLTKLKGISIPLPPLGEQHRIVELLSSLDDKIELNRRMNETLEAMAQAIFRDWFVDFGPTRRKLEGASNPVAIMGGLVQEADRARALADLFPAMLGDNGLPDEWNACAISALVEFNPKQPLKKGTLAPYSDMSSLPTNGSIAEPPVQREYGSGMRFKNNDALLARITPCLENGKAAFVDFLADAETVGWGSTEFYVVRSRQGVPPPFAYLLVRHPEFRATAIASMTGTSGRQRAQVDRLADFPFVAPKSEILTAFADFVLPAFGKISANGRENRTLAATRDLLLPKLMSGDIRLGEARDRAREVA
ncbi:restriction endonuclease subunit S [Stappia sp. ICDLI1TA098]